MERTNRSGELVESPPDYVAIEVPDHVVRERVFVERTRPNAMHNEESLEEDDSFLSVGSETWDYDVVKGREMEFLDAVRNSQMVMECVPLDDEAASR